MNIKVFTTHNRKFWALHIYMYIYIYMYVWRCFNHRYYIQVCVYSVNVLYVTLKEMKKIKLQILTADTHTQFYYQCHKQYSDSCCWLSFQLYKVSTLQNFNALLTNLHFQKNIDRMVFDYCHVSKIIYIYIAIYKSISVIIIISEVSYQKIFLKDI